MVGEPAGRTAVERTCERCGERFLAKPAFVARGKARFCSPPCRSAAHRKPGWSPAGACAQCGAPVKKARGRYCSRTCSGAGRRAATERNHLERACAQCGVRFPTYPSVVERGHARFCSRGCKTVASRQHELRKRPCARCGATFIPTSRNSARRFCTPACANLAQRGPEQVLTCAQCGAERRYRAGVQVGRFCSPRCAGLARRTRVERTCERCGTSFEQYPFVIARGFGRFCSRACYGGARALPLGRGALDIECRVCGTFRRVPSRDLRAGNGKFCSRACHGEWMRRGRTPLECRQCRKKFAALPGQPGRKFCTRRCYNQSRRPRVFRCGACRSPFPSRVWRKPRFCSRSCANKGRRLERHPQAAARNRRIMELHADGAKAPVIWGRLLSEGLGDWEPATIRQVISRELRAAAAPRGPHGRTVTSRHLEGRRAPTRERSAEMT